MSICSRGWEIQGFSQRWQSCHVFQKTLRCFQTMASVLSDIFNGCPRSRSDIHYLSPNCVISKVFFPFRVNVLWAFVCRNISYIWKAWLRHIHSSQKLFGISVKTKALHCPYTVIHQALSNNKLMHASIFKYNSHYRWSVDKVDRLINTSVTEKSCWNTITGPVSVSCIRIQSVQPWATRGHNLNREFFLWTPQKRHKVVWIKSKAHCAPMRGSDKNFHLHMKPSVVHLQ